jgi:hypothetical protein
MINYIEKGSNMHNYLANQGLRIWERDGVWMSDANHDLVNAAILAYQPYEPDQIILIDEKVTEILGVFTQGASIAELLTWPIQEMEARAGSGPLLTAMAAERGVTVEALSAELVARADAYAAAAGQAIGKRRRLKDRIDAGELGVVWDEEE